jgi:hypothetical protein
MLFSLPPISVVDQSGQCVSYNECECATQHLNGHCRLHKPLLGEWSKVEQQGVKNGKIRGFENLAGLRVRG